MNEIGYMLPYIVWNKKMPYDTFFWKLLETILVCFSVADIPRPKNSVTSIAFPRFHFASFLFPAFSLTANNWKMSVVRDYWCGLDGRIDIGWGGAFYKISENIYFGRKLKLKNFSLQAAFYS